MIKNKLDIQQAVDQYLESKALAWSPSTMKSERARLAAVVEVLEVAGLDPAAVYKKLADKYKPYSLKTTFIRLAAFELEAFGTANFSAFNRTHSRLFKHAYLPERLKLDFQEAVAKIELLQDPAIKAKAKELLYSGMRYTESTTETDGIVVGKGGKKREVFKPDTDVKYDGTYIKFWRALRKVGLKPHTLRKLRATNLVEHGASLPDLMEIMGWSSLNTASSYLQPKRKAQLAQLMKETAQV